jgi:CubicO group peptidase (beta-lactamase class C family)
MWDGPVILFDHQGISRRWFGGSGWEKLTIRHLLNMRSGLDFDDEYEFNAKALKAVNAIARLNYGHNLMKQIRGLKSIEVVFMGGRWPYKSLSLYVSNSHESFTCCLFALL